MAGFRKDKTGAAQTAANAAATLVAAFAGSFGEFKEAVEAYHDLRADIYEDLEKVVDADNELFASVEDSGSKSSGGSRSKGSSSRSGGSSKGGSSRGRKTGGGGGRGSGKSSITLDDALGMELNFGAFEGETLETVLGLSVDECDENYGYGDGERDGSDYISWLAGSNNKNEYVQRRARLIADDNDIEYDA